MKLAWTRLALNDRQAIRSYIAQDNPIATLALDELFTEKASRLADHPGLGRPGRVSGTRELVVHQHDLMIYDLVNDQVRILRVLHTARQWPSAD
ncbi:type II toxin-antitoxin system mRNA interferase toxin, RelE/StbE family [Ectopseudomonas oleovorans]|uniref:Addiction module antitoxin n=2 Tax=Ectopseudomonas oleovorans TaxID=301 RepID=A0A061CTV3_ECTOL|nr:MULTISPECIES: type II toxin-antitoxin system mRNA interferase toxin, RelE/StbE family [Pseudomonas]MBP8885328.1 type II toxin-antitoxin system mRNA interferase toxin, RelE/StbE family [Pseudomonas sp.]AXO60574.1 type II toxin-antitoxin system mRNA interferase toxin, RelE/StbE family [Pseudomonas sp. phDV1]MBN7117917.1 translation repressor RelE [Pseudomonas oleovorans]MBN7131467.1 translation repressor RelE [Pseudomonas oleovorans]MBN7143006.1 translation repressor RelE [Pseudomonas oleovor